MLEDRLQGLCRNGVAAPRLGSIFRFTRRLRAGLTSLPPLRGSFGRFRGGLSRRKIALPVAAQSLQLS
jgi:hypothetical protein